MAGKAPSEQAAASPLRSISGLVIANSSLVVAILVYMGWEYTNAYWGYFQVDPLNLGVGVLEYLLRSLSLFNPVIVIVAVAVVAATAARNRVAPLARRAVPWTGKADGNIPGKLLKDIRVAAGTLVTALALAFWAAGLVPVSTYLLLALLASGSLLLARPASDSPASDNKEARLPQVLATVVTVLCALWAGSIYAQGQGTAAARHLARDLQDGRTAVAVYSVHPLSLRGKGVTEQHFPAGLLYRYRYEGLRLLTMRSGTYYLLPEHWSRKLDTTYVLDDSAQIRVELYGGVQPSG